MTSFLIKVSKIFELYKNKSAKPICCCNILPTLCVVELIDHRKQFLWCALSLWVLAWQPDLQISFQIQDNVKTTKHRFAQQPQITNQCDDNALLFKEMSVVLGEFDWSHLSIKNMQNRCVSTMTGQSVRMLLQGLLAWGLAKTAMR